MVFLSDRPNVTESKFFGFYEFFKGGKFRLVPSQVITYIAFDLRFDNFFVSDKYENIGHPDPMAEGKSRRCTFNIIAKDHKTGELLSPTYPGTYPKV